MFSLRHSSQSYWLWNNHNHSLFSVGPRLFRIRMFKGWSANGKIYLWKVMRVISVYMFMCNLLFGSLFSFKLSEFRQQAYHLFQAPNQVCWYFLWMLIVLSRVQKTKVWNSPSSSTWKPTQLPFLGRPNVCVWSESVSPCQSCPTLCDPMDCGPPGTSVHRIPRQEYWSRLPFPSPGNLPEPGIEPRSPALQVDSLPSEPPGTSYTHTHTHTHNHNKVKKSFPAFWAVSQSMTIVLSVDNSTFHGREMLD